MSTNQTQTVTPSHEMTFDLREFRTVKMLIQEYPDLISENALRWVLRLRFENGLEQHTTKLGKHLLIHVPGFTAWLMRQNTQVGR